MFPQHVTASVEVPGTQISVVDKITTLSSFQRQISFIPFKIGSHTVQNSAVPGSETSAVAKVFIQYILYHRISIKYHLSHSK